MKFAARRKALATTALSAFLSVASTQEPLPPEVQADMLERQIILALERADVPEVLTLMDRYRSLKVPVPPPLLFVDAKAASAAQNPIRAVESLANFLKVAARDGRQYQEALSLYPQYEARAREARSKIDVWSLPDFIETASLFKAGKYHLADYSLRQIRESGTANQSYLDRAQKEIDQSIADASVRIGKQVEQQLKFQHFPDGEFPNHTISVKGIVGDTTVLDVSLTGGTASLPAFKIAPISEESVALYCSVVKIDKLKSHLAGAPLDKVFDKCPSKRYDVREFVAWLSRTTGSKYSVPTLPQALT